MRAGPPSGMIGLKPMWSNICVCISMPGATSASTMPWAVLLITHRSVMNVTRFPFARHCCALKESCAQDSTNLSKRPSWSMHILPSSMWHFSPPAVNEPTKMECLALADILGKPPTPAILPLRNVVFTLPSLSTSLSPNTATSSPPWSKKLKWSVWGYMATGL